MRIFSKMKKAMLVLVASLFCVNVAFADTQTVYSWESPDGTPIETGGTIVHASGDGKRVNYSNAGYFTVCLNGKYGNMNDGDGAKNSDHIVLTLDDALQKGDVISITAYRNKDAEGKSSSIYFLFENGTAWKDSNVFTNICADDVDADYDDDGDTPNTVTWTITDAEAGSKIIKMSRNSAGTNLFITKLAITREVIVEPVVEAIALTADIYKVWNGVGADAQATSDAAYCEMNFGADKTVSQGNTLYGNGNVLCKQYADLTGYSKIMFEGTPGLTVRLLINRQLPVEGGDPNGGSYIEKLPVLGEDGKGELDLSEFEYVHLNAIKIPWNGTANAIITKIVLVKSVSTGFDLTAYNQAVADAEALKAQLDPTDWMQEELIVALDEAIAFAKEGVDVAASQEDVDISANMLAETVAGYKANVEKQLMMAEAQRVQMIADSVFNSYPEDLRTDNAGLINAMMALPSMRFWGTYDEGMALCKACEDAIVAFQTENAPVVTKVEVEIVNPTVDNNQNGWTSNTNAQNKALATNKVEGTVFTGKFLENWLGSPITGEIYQEVANLPAGQYQLQMGAFAELQSAGTAGVAYVFANEASVEVNTLAPTVYTVDATLAEAGTLKIGLRIDGGANWVGFDNVKLYRTTTTTLGQEINVLNAVLESVEDLKASYAEVVEVEALDAAVAAVLKGTVDECKASVKALNAAMKAFKAANDLHVKVLDLANATNVSPKDATFLIANANFDNGVASWEGAPSVNFSCGEKWNTNFDVYQELTGLRNGYYKLSVQGYYRAGNGGTTALEQHAYLYAGNESTPLMNILAEAGKEGQSTATDWTMSNVEGYGYVPNNMETASIAFGNGLYNDNSIVVQVTDGTLRIGVKKETLIDLDWTIFDNFQLLYYGTEEPLALEPGTYYMKNLGSGKYLVAANSWGTQASLGNYGLDVDVAYVGNGKYTVDTRVSNGGSNHFLGSNGYVDSPAAEWTFVEQGNGYFALTADGTNYIGYDGNSSVTSITLTDAASANAQWKFVTKAELEATLANATMTNPVDATFFIQGQNFGRNDGRNSAWQGSPAIGGDNANMCAEKWNCNFDVYQDLANLPNGYYKISVQGYYRAGNGGATAMDQHAYLYASEASTPLVNINTEAGNSIFNGGNVSDVAGMGIVPNNMATASTAFTAGLYADNSVFAQVTDGTLRIGVKKEALINADWTIFDNFQLFYYGTENPAPMLAAVDSLNKLIVEVEAWKTKLNAEDEMEAMVIAQTEQMLAAAKAMAAAPASVDEVNGMITSINQFIYMTEVSLAQYKAQAAMMLFASYDEPSDKAGFENAINQVFIVSNALMMGGEYTMADLDAALATMRVAQKAFIYENPKAPNYSIVAVQGVNRVVALTNELEGLKFYYKTAADAEYMVYTAPFHISSTTTVWTYAEYTEPVSGDVFTSDEAEYEIAAGSAIPLNKPTVEITGDIEYTCVVTSDQSDLFVKYGVTVTPKDTIIYEFFPWNEVKDEPARVPSISGTMASGESLTLPAGLLIVKVAAYGFETAVARELLGLTEEQVDVDAFVTGIDEVDGKEVKEIKYYTINGVEIEEPVADVHIRRILFTDGSVKIMKVAGK